ncbi:MAG TPA: DUF2845 domain-containing protein [Luteimonas sp.]|nr:DUF2845 domain-containing protein [Luteimonas sp.]
MRTPLAIFLALALCGAAWAADYSVRFDHGVVTLGDSAGTVARKAGKPDRTVQLENAFGGANGERWEYHLPEKQVNIVLRDGKVVDIEEVR